MTVKFRTYCLLLAFTLASSVPTLVHAERSGSTQGKKSENKPVTMYEPIKESLTDLINGGARVITGGFYSSGPSVLVQKDKTYILCLVHQKGGLYNAKDNTSVCSRLN